jgi:hypothetical protein
MNLGFSAYTWVHVILSLIGIASGLVVVKGMLAHQRLDGWTAVFLATTILTSVTGFGFPFERLLPSHVFGAVSLLLLLVAVALRVRNERVVAAGLFSDGDSRSVDERVRPGGAAIQQSPGAQCPRPEPGGPAIPHCSNRRIVAVHRLRHCRFAECSRGHGVIRERTRARSSGQAFPGNLAARAGA